MTLLPPSLDDWERVRQWRMTCPESLRTPYPLTMQQQHEHYRDVVCDRNSPDKWWMYGLSCAVGLQGISPTNRRAEVSLIVDPKHRGEGIGSDAFRALLRHAWNVLNLHTVWGECYYCSRSLDFWQGLVRELGGQGSRIPHTKWWDGKWQDSWLFTVVSPIDGPPPATYTGGMDPNA